VINVSAPYLLWLLILIAWTTALAVLMVIFIIVRADRRDIECILRGLAELVDALFWWKPPRMRGPGDRKGS
jgi:hypothetical protein